MTRLQHSAVDCRCSRRLPLAQALSPTPAAIQRLTPRRSSALEDLRAAIPSSDRPNEQRRALDRNSDGDLRRGTCQPPLIASRSAPIFYDTCTIALGGDPDAYDSGQRCRLDAGRRHRRRPLSSAIYPARAISTATARSTSGARSNLADAVARLLPGRFRRLDIAIDLARPDRLEGLTGTVSRDEANATGWAIADKKLLVIADRIRRPGRRSSSTCCSATSRRLSRNAPCPSSSTRTPAFWSRG